MPNIKIAEWPNKLGYNVTRNGRMYEMSITPSGVSLTRTEKDSGSLTGYRVTHWVRLHQPGARMSDALEYLEETIKRRSWNECY